MNLYNEEAFAHKEAPISFWRYLTSSSFGQAVMENWQSEYLQFALCAGHGLAAAERLT